MYLRKEFEARAAWRFIISSCSQQVRGQRDDRLPDQQADPRVHHQEPAQPDGGEDQPVLHVWDGNRHEHLGLDQGHHPHLETDLVQVSKRRTVLCGHGCTSESVRSRSLCFLSVVMFVVTFGCLISSRTNQTEQGSYKVLSRGHKFPQILAVRLQCVHSGWLC